MTAFSPTAARLALSIDVEDWFQVENLRAAVPASSWSQRELRVEQNTARMLQALSEQNVRGTFFVLGWVAERCPELVRRIVASGHELGCHGYGHDLLNKLTPDAFREDLKRAKGLLEEHTGSRVLGYRAPSFSITDWAIDVLKEEGFAYDSSAFATVAHDRYGKLQGLERGEPITELRDDFYEVSISSLNVFGHSLPWGGGGYFRLLPYAVFKTGIREILRRGDPYIFYIHPWEIDPAQPRVQVRASYAFRHYLNLDRCFARFQALLSDFRWGTIRELLPAER
ncbi:MAG: DUF3473 domain-containing protein [Polyangiaceae bacterium]|nr:DUF3473 domain-containing protein [Polyangiaceae bacterium]